MVKGWRENVDKPSGAEKTSQCQVISYSLIFIIDEILVRCIC